MYSVSLIVVYKQRPLRAEEGFVVFACQAYCLKYMEGSKPDKISHAQKHVKPLCNAESSTQGQN